MRTSTVIAAAALLAPAAALATPTNPFARKAKSPVPVNVGAGKAIAFKLNKDNDLIGGVVSDDDGRANLAAPYIAVPIIPEGPIAAADLEHTDDDKHGRPHGSNGQTPPFWGGQGDCCKPTEQCHAYVKWMLDMHNSNGWESDEQRAEANSHIECCLRQYRASCDSSMSGDTIVWRDPSKYCSPGKGAGLPKIPEGGKEKEEEKEDEKGDDKEGEKGEKHGHGPEYEHDREVE